MAFVGVNDPANLELGPANVFLRDPISGDDLILGFMGEDMAITISTEAADLTGAQRGNVPLDKVVIGGFFRITIPFKEITLENFQRAIPNAEIFTTGGTKVEFRPRVGLSLRSIATRMTIIKIIGGIQSTLTEDTFIIPLAAAADAEVSFPFSPTEQRVILANFEAFTDETLGGRWGFVGDEFAS
jgi:hypothetical protein